MTTPGSNPPPPLPPTAGDNKSPIFSKFIRRASRALKSRSIASSGEIGLPAPNVESKSMTTPRPLAGAARNAIPVRETLLRSIAPTDRTYTSSTQYLKLREEKARALFEKYGMNLSPEEWTSPSTGKTQWVEKKIVMRVHRQCHRCQTTFGRDKICFQCQHTRCKKCPRYPLKMTGEKMGIARFDIDYSVLVDPLHDAKLGIINTRRLTVQTKSGREAVRKQVTQRVRRTCHRCEKLFMGKATACDGCQHQRCPKCPRDP